jgi:hypothetical protein
MNDNAILLAIQELMDGVDWSPDTLNAIAALLNENGYEIKDSNE